MGSDFQAPIRTWQACREAIPNLVKRGSAIFIGHKFINGVWKYYSSRVPFDILQQFTMFLSHSIGLKHVCAIRVTNGIGSVQAIPGFSSSHTIYWNGNERHTYHAVEVGGSSHGQINFKELDHERWSTMLSLTAFCAPDDSYQLAERAEPPDTSVPESKSQPSDPTGSSSCRGS